MGERWSREDSKPHSDHPASISISLNKLLPVSHLHCRCLYFFTVQTESLRSMLFVQKSTVSNHFHIHFFFIRVLDLPYEESKVTLTYSWSLNNARIRGAHPVSPKTAYKFWLPRNLAANTIAYCWPEALLIANSWIIHILYSISTMDCILNKKVS